MELMAKFVRPLIKKRVHHKIIIFFTPDLEKMVGAPPCFWLSF